MGETVKLVFSLSISGGFFAITLFALKPFMRNRLSKSFQYYAWLVVLFRFILPLSFGINLMDFMSNMPNALQMVEETVILNNNLENLADINMAGQQSSAPISTNNAKSLDVMRTLTENLLWIWIAGAVISAAFTILVHLRFIRYIQGAAYEVEIPDCGAKVYKSHFTPTPMLVGMIKPRIYLPDVEYTNEQLNNILLHELTHLRRCDVCLKWLSALVVSVHWFNPVVYFIRCEFNRACELSCDEAVIRNLDDTGKQSYGNTLISVVAKNRYPVGVMSTTMCEEKKKLKERLVAIMNYKRKTKFIVLITAVLAVILTGSALVFGANIVFVGNQPVDAYMPPESVGFEEQDGLVYPVNERGQTYGSALETSSITTLPDLIYAGSVDKIKGYVYTKDLLDSMPETPEEAQFIMEKPKTFPLYKEDGNTVIGNIGYCVGLLPESVRNEYLVPIYPVNKNGQTYGVDMLDTFMQSPDLVAAIGINGSKGYVYKSDLEEEQPNNPDEALEYMKQLNERKAEMKITGEKYVRIIPLYTEDGVTVIGEFGISSGLVIQMP